MVTRQLYHPYGTVRHSEGTLPTDFTFTGQRADASTGLMDSRARYYHPGLGRFISADPLVPEPGNPQALNRYAYVFGNPLKYVDPTGYFTEEAIVKYLQGIYGSQVLEDTKELMWQIVLRRWKGNEALWNLLSAAEAGDILMYVGSNNQIAFGRFLGEGQHMLAGIEGIPLPDLEQVSGLGDLRLPKVLQNEIVGLFSYDHAHLRLKYSNPGLGTWDTVSAGVVPAFRGRFFTGLMLLAPTYYAPPAQGIWALVKYAIAWGINWQLSEMVGKYLPELKAGNDEVFASNARGHELEVTLDRGIVVSSFISRWDWSSAGIPLP